MKVCITISSLACLLLFSAHLSAAERTPYELRDVGITERLGERLPLDAVFTDDHGNAVTLDHYFSGKRPAILALVYYRCPSLCNLLLNGLTDALKQITWTPGEQFDVIAVSINPLETPELAAEKKAAYLEVLGRPHAASGVHLLTGNEEQIRRVADAVGFSYRYDPVQKEYAHGAALQIITPDGIISRYLSGIMFNPRDVKLALIEAGQGKVGNVLDRLFLYCYHYDPQGKKYALFATNVLKLAAALTVLALGLTLVLLMRKKRRML